MLGIVVSVIIDGSEYFGLGKSREGMTGYLHPIGLPRCSHPRDFCGSGSVFNALHYMNKCQQIFIVALTQFCPREGFLESRVETFSPAAL